MIKLNKQKFFIDFDDCLVMSSKSFIESYKQLYNDYRDINYLENNDWNFNTLCPKLNGDNKKVAEIFHSKEFFDNLIPYPFANEVLAKWKDKYDYYIVTIGTPQNLKYKIDFINKYFPEIKNLILLSTEQLKMDKSTIKMSSDNMFPNIFIDDHFGNLNSSDCEIRLLYKSMGDKLWNKDWQGLSCKDWTEVDKCLERYYYGGNND